MKFQSLVSQIGKPVNAREALTGRSSAWIADRFGVSRRTAQRWKAGTQQPAEREGRKERVMGSADSATRRKVAADALRGAQAAHVGRVEVMDKSPRKGTKQARNFRNVGTVTLDEGARERLGRAADALESGDVNRAEQLTSEGVLRTSGKDYGSALDVADWPAGFHLI